MKSWFRESSVLGLAAALALFFFAMPGETAAKEKGVLIIGTASPILSLDPSSSGAAPLTMLSRSIFQGLVRYKFNSTEIEGALARSWSVSKDGLVYTFKLRENVNWHKGFGRVTAQDVKFSFDRILDPKTRSLFIGDIGVVKEVKVVDDLTVAVHLKGRDVAFLHKCVVRPVAILCQKAVEKFGKDMGRNPVGCGPYVFESMSREEIVVTANKEYWGESPKIGKVILKTIPDTDTQIMALLKGEIDYVTSILLEKTYVDRVKAGNCLIKGVDEGQFNFLLMNSKVAPLADLRVRRAIAHAINKDEIIKSMYVPGAAESMASPVPKGYWGHTETGLRRYDFDPQKAKELLAEAGYPNGFEVTFDSPNTPLYVPVVTAIQGQLANVGIRVKLDVSDQPAWSKRVMSGTTQMTLFKPSRFPDADSILTTFYHSASFPPGYNLARYDKLDKEIEEARGEANPTKRLKMYQDMQARLMEEIPLIPLIKDNKGIAHRSNIAGIPDRDPVYGPDFYHLYFKD